MDKIELFEDLIFDLTASMNSDWHKAGVRVDTCDEDELKSMLDRDVKPQTRIIFTPDEDDSNRWEGPYFYIFREGAPDFSTSQEWEIDYREVVFKCHCATMSGPRVLKRLAKAFEKLFGKTAKKDNEPLFNVYFSTDTEESGDPAYTQQTLEQCEKICKDVYKQFTEGSFNPWGWGVLDPNEDKLDVMCYCCNGLTDDEFGMLTYGPDAGKFRDYPRAAAKREALERITKSPLKESNGKYDVYFYLENTSKFLDGYLANGVSLEEGKAICEKFIKRFKGGEFDPWDEYNLDGGPGESYLLDPEDDDLVVVCLGDDDTDEYGISTFGPQAGQFVKSPMTWEEYTEWWKQQNANKPKKPTKARFIHNEEPADDPDYFEGIIKTNDGEVEEPYTGERINGVWVTYPGGEKWPGHLSKDQVKKMFLQKRRW